MLQRRTGASLVERLFEVAALLEASIDNVVGSRVMIDVVELKLR
jgi:hypothetical protein